MAKKVPASARLFSGVFPTGISYADKLRKRDGDYMRVAFLPFSTLELEWAPGKHPLDLRKLVEADAAVIIARRGQAYPVSASGQTVTLGFGGPKRHHATKKAPAQLQREIDEVLAGTSKNYGTTRFGVALGGLHYQVIVERDRDRGGFAAKLVSEGIGTIMEPNGKTPGDALAALVQDLRAGVATDQKLAALIAQFYWGSATGDGAPSTTRQNAKGGERAHATKRAPSRGGLPLRDDVTELEYQRPPTASEIRFGHGATHYRSFPVEEVVFPGTRIPKKWFVASDDGLRYKR